MKKFLVTSVVLMTMSVLACEQPALAQWDNRGCSQYGVSAAAPETIEYSLWTFRSNVWDGYIDFQEGGKYLTHWGWGTWTVTPDGKGLHLANDYNDRTYEIAFTDSGFRYQGIGNNGLIISGLLLCSKYQGPGPQVPDEVASEIKLLYLNILGREPDPKEYLGQLRSYVQGVSVETMKEQMLQSPEYIKITAEAVKKVRELEASGQLGW